MSNASEQPVLPKYGDWRLVGARRVKFGPQLVRLQSGSRRPGWAELPLSGSKGLNRAAPPITRQLEQLSNVSATRYLVPGLGRSGSPPLGSARLCSRVWCRFPSGPVPAGHTSALHASFQLPASTSIALLKSIVAAPCIRILDHQRSL